MKALSLSLFSSLAMAGLAYGQAENTTVTAPTPAVSETAAPADRYPLIMMGVVDNADDFKRLAAMGFSHVHCYGGIFTGDPGNPEAMAKIEHYLDLAQAHGLKVMFDLSGSRRVERGQLGAKETQALVKRFKDHPAVGFWYAYDEPNLPAGGSQRAREAARMQEQLPEGMAPKVEMKVSPAALLPFYQAIKDESPDIPVIVLMWITDLPGWKDAWKGYLDGLDIISFNTYPVYHEPFPEAPLDRVSQWTAEYTTGGKPVLPCLQVFNWKTIPKRLERAKAAGNLHADDWRYPNEQELRYWNFTSLIQGTPALLYYVYGGRSKERRAPDAWLDGDLKTTMLEIREFTDLVAGAERTVHLEGGEEAVYLASWKKGEKDYWVLVNGKGTARTFTHPRLNGLSAEAQVTPWKTTRADAITRSEDSAPSIRLAPWETLIWEVKR